MTRRRWTPAEVRRLRKLYPTRPTSELAVIFGRPLRAIYAKAIGMGLRKTAEYLASPAACRLRRGGNVGASTRFQKGHVPANKGLRRPGWAPGRMRETQFRPGRPAHECPRYRPIGSLRVIRGVLERKVTDDPKLYPARRWTPVARLVWEAERRASALPGIPPMTNQPKNGATAPEIESPEPEIVAPSVPATSRTITSAEQAAGALRDQIRKTYLSAAELRSSPGLSAGECESVESVMKRQLESIAELDALVEARKAARGGAAS